MNKELINMINKASDEFKDPKYKDANAIDFNNIDDTTYGFTKDAANNLYNAAITAEKEGFVENVNIKTDGLKMNSETNIGSLKITKFSFKR